MSEELQTDQIDPMKQHRCDLSIVMQNGCYHNVNGSSCGGCNGFLTLSFLIKHACSVTVHYSQVACAGDVNKLVVASADSW